MARATKRSKRNGNRKKGQGILFETIGFLALLGTAVITWQPQLITHALENAGKNSDLNGASGNTELEKMALQSTKFQRPSTNQRRDRQD